MLSLCGQSFQTAALCPTTATGLSQAACLIDHCRAHAVNALSRGQDCAHAVAVESRDRDGLIPAAVNKAGKSKSIVAIGLVRLKLQGCCSAPSMDAIDRNPEVAKRMPELDGLRPCFYADADQIGGLALMTVAIATAVLRTLPSQIRWPASSTTQTAVSFMHTSGPTKCFIVSSMLMKATA